MSTFLGSLSEKLKAMEQEIQALPEELHSIVARLDRGKLQSVLIRLEQDCYQLYEKQSAAQRRAAITLPIIMELSYPYFRQITDEDLSRWREAYKSKVRVVIGEGKVEVMAASEIAGKYETTVSQITIVAQQQGFIVLRWGQYIKLLDEIGKLIGE